MGWQWAAHLWKLESIQQATRHRQYVAAEINERRRLPHLVTQHGSEWLHYSTTVSANGLRIICWRRSSVTRTVRNQRGVPTRKKKKKKLSGRSRHAAALHSLTT